jgi:ribosome-binding protein aMBF1 (putative translation factor)
MGFFVGRTFLYTGPFGPNGPKTRGPTNGFRLSEPTSLQAVAISIVANPCAAREADAHLTSAKTTLWESDNEAVGVEPQASVRTTSPTMLGRFADWRHLASVTRSGYTVIMAKRKKTPPTLTQTIRTAIEARGLTAYRVAKVIETQPHVVQRFLNGERDLRGVTLDKLAVALGLALVESNEGHPDMRGKIDGIVS